MHRRALLGLAGVATASVVHAPVLAAPATPSAADTDAANTQLATTFIQRVLNARDGAALDAMLDPNMTPANPNDAPGAAAFHARLSNWLEIIGFDVKPAHFSAETVIAQGNDIIVRGTISGPSPQGKAIHATYFVQLRIASGKVVKAWYVYDNAELNAF